eukprot:CAMPEP_0204909042 /NCGR_PEP_ID=MMETSP1397-20131031/7851_1 /ASSEMBLY_ACC=CAM_ASM_000891 /TAXON_ID=49980 /ORGANISM="Climacostomum Climacostomum virens, Strain Stock W-24" /LENGTH=328 /DNA_ID=CAMNT_0052078763 /DNA_START=23 /DNA_END=1009 /DNA_ORIENTATION=+
MDLSQSSPPFLEKTFTQLRAQLVEHTEDLAFRFWLDNEALPHFLRKVEAAYFNLIFHSELSPETMGLDREFIASLKRKDEYARLSRLLARWNVEIELSVDLIERACLYKLYAKPAVLRNIKDEIRKNWGIRDDSMMKRCVIRILNFAAYSTAHWSSEVIEHTTSRLAFNFSNLKMTALTSLLYMFMGTAFPIAFLHVVGSQASLAIGGWVAAKAGDSIHHAFDAYAMKSKLKGIDTQLEALLSQLTYANTQCANAITSCAQTMTEGEKLSLNKLLSQLIVQRPSSEDLRASYMEETEMIDNIRVTEVDDYLLVELVEPSIEVSTFKPF